VTDKENAMRCCALLVILLLAGCSDAGTTRNFGMSRDTTPQTVAATQMPLSMPPSLAVRPTRPGAIAPSRGTASPADQAAGSEGQDALIQAAGPAPSSDIRTVINEKSGLVYGDSNFVDQLMSWTPPPGYTPIITQGAKGGWFSRMF
jgi:hypothetical protein